MKESSTPRDSSLTKIARAVVFFEFLCYNECGDDMDKEKELPKRKPTRLRNFDYSTMGAYFITICTEKRRKILSHVVEDNFTATDMCCSENVGGDVLDAPKNVELLPHGKIADKYINQLNDFYENIIVDKYVIMPNHIHIMLFVFEGGASRTSPPTVKQHSAVSRFVSTFKRFCNKDYGENIWQRHFHDHIIRNRQDYEEHVKYIHENPARWYFDELYSE